MTAELLPERLMEAALELFRANGFDKVQLSNIAQAVECPIDDLYRHFPRKESFILRLYERFAGEMETTVPDLPKGTIAERFAFAMSLKLKLLEPHLEIMRSLMSAALDPTHRLAILGPSSDRIRWRVQGVFSAVVLGASDAPTTEQAPRLVRFLYAVHMMCVFCAMQDQTQDKTFTTEGIEFAKDLVRLASKWITNGKTSMLSNWMASAFGFPNLSGFADRADRLSTMLVQPPHDSTHFTLAENILRDLFRHRRLLPGAGTCATEPCAQCLALHLPRVQSAIASGKTIQLVLPAFPCKSANPKKVIGKLPDFGEELALRFLDERCQAIADRYPPGAKLTICSDGRVFNDLVGVKDQDVTDYGTKIAEMIDKMKLHSISLFDLDVVRPGESYEQLRNWLVDKYAEPISAIIERTENHEHHQHFYNGIHRFLTEDLAAREPTLSKTQARNRSKQTAYEVIQRSNAWSRLVSVNYPEALRLSIHPQLPHSDKIGILLTPADDAWLTPWHGTILIENDRFRLTHRSEAEALNAGLVERDGRPSHFELTK